MEKQAKSDISGSPSPMASSEKRGKVLAEIMETEYTCVFVQCGGMCDGLCVVVGDGFFIPMIYSLSAWRRC